MATAPVRSLLMRAARQGAAAPVLRPSRRCYGRSRLLAAVAGTGTGGGPGPGPGDDDGGDGDGDGGCGGGIPRAASLEGMGLTNGRIRDSVRGGGRTVPVRARRRRTFGERVPAPAVPGGRAGRKPGVRIVCEAPAAPSADAVAVLAVAAEEEEEEEEDAKATKAAVDARADRVRVKAMHAAKNIDVVAVLEKVFGGGGSVASVLGQLNIGPPRRHVFGKNAESLLVEFPGPPHTGEGGGGGGGEGDVSGRDRDRDRSVDRRNRPLPSPRYAAVFRFGSVVFLNMTTRESGRILSEIKSHASDPVSAGFEKMEHFQVEVRPDLPEATGEVTFDFATVKQLEMNSVAVIAKIMAQTVALDSYSDTVDELLAAFSEINASVKRAGAFSDMDKATLFRVVAQNNSIIIDLVGKLGMKDRSGTAWNLVEYQSVYEGMKEEFELDERFDNLEYKLNTVQSNAKYFLEMLQHDKSNNLEWIIVVLIAFESVLMILEMSGAGEKIFGGLF